MSAPATAVPPGGLSFSAAPTASGWLALLKEEDKALRTAALSQLLQTVDTAWHEIAENLPELEAMAEDVSQDKQVQQTAAAVASRVFFHLEEPQQALRLALQAGPQHFDPATPSPYVERLVAAALDAYVQARQQLQDEPATATSTTTSTTTTTADQDGLSLTQLQTMVYRLIDSSCQEGNFHFAVGICLEAQEPAQLQQVLTKANSSDCWHYTLHLLTGTTVLASKAFRLQALQVLAETCPTTAQQHQQQLTSDLLVIYQCLGQAPQVADCLYQLLLASNNTDDQLMGLQLCFDLVETGDQAFGNQVAELLKNKSVTPDTDASTDEDLPPTIAKALRVLTAGFSAELALSFLHKTNHADRLIMEQLKKALEERSSGSRSSVLHNAAVLTHSYLYAGTTNDSFLRDYLDWMKKASNWAKFSATASLGVVHAGHVTEAMHLLQPYLPSDPAQEDNEISPSGGYAQGGSLYALGLVHARPGTDATQRQEATQFIRQHLRASHANEVISHGACLGVGLTAMGTADHAIVQELKDVLDTDSAVAGEAAGIAIGLILVGTGAGSTQHNLDDAHVEEIQDMVSELKNYARETQHEKIIRGIAMGLALMQFGQEENADAVIEELRSDRDPILRYGAQYATAMAYCGTGSNKAIRLLLHTAVSDVSDDVRMASVIGLAFVLYKTPERVPQLVALLLESFNPHVRYASCMAVGVAMAGTGNADAIALLEPMLDDMTDYVRQGALMGTAMIYMQQPVDRRVRLFREKLGTIVTEKHQSTLTKMGAIMSSGILDSGGRNCVLMLGSRQGFTKRTTAVGLALWLQHWHWFPMMHMWSLALTPTYTMGLNGDFKYPKKFEIVCNAKPSAFAYPKKMEEKKEEKKKRVETVTLSITAKENARLARKRAKLGLDDGDAMQVEDGDAKKDGAKEGGEETKDEDAMQVEEAEDEKKPKKKREPEPSSFRIPNPARMTQAQIALCELDLEQRYRPIRPNQKMLGGVLMLTDSRPEEPEEELAAVRSPTDEPEGELPPPEPFVWTVPPLPEVKEESKEAESKSSEE